MFDCIEYQEDCFECNGNNTLNVKASVNVDTGEVVKFHEQECYACGWNQLS
jgi:hypothetical protein